MKRLSLEELKAQKNNQKVLVKIESIKGGDVDGCHLDPNCCYPPPKPKE